MEETAPSFQPTANPAYLFWLLGGGVVGVVSYTLRAPGAVGGAVPLGLLVACASAVCGGLLGFLFGIPRTLQIDAGTQTKEGVVPQSDPTATADRERASQPSYRPNTNLEQISDWLTKILVGIGLTQLPTIDDRMRKLTHFVGQSITDAPSGTPFAYATVIFFSVCGFLLGFLWTRLYLPSALIVSDLASEALAEAAKANKRLDVVEDQQLSDARALNLVRRQLEPGAAEPSVRLDELCKAVKGASPAMRAHIFTWAQTQRKSNWRENKPAMERTIPVFEALLGADSGVHRTHAQLGFALKEKTSPTAEDYKRAADELSTAIQLRGPWQQEGWLFYELNRAMCLIRLDAQFAKKEPSAPESRTAILGDLRAAMHDVGWALPIIQRDATIQSWLKTNGVMEQDLSVPE